jgi:very-short-patch-repair endonuclease
MANERARRLRKTMTPQEVKLWVRLREFRDNGHHFRRQVPLDSFILDFVCFGSKLIVEVDGGQHGMKTGQDRDQLRYAHFSRHGFRILRFWTNEVDQNMSGVLETIVGALSAAPPPRPPSAGDPPRKGEG